MAKLLSVAEADARIQASLSPVPAEDAALSAAMGRRLLTPVLADRDLPPYDRAMMDGIAFSSVSGGDSSRPSFTLAGLHAAGDPPPSPLASGHAWEIMTGASVPPDCDTVVPYEDLSSDNRQVQAEFSRGQFIHRAGSDSKAGDVLIPAGSVIGAPEIAIAASVGLDSLNVPRRPRVALLSTGDEAVPHTTTPEPWQIRRSNGPALAAVIEHMGLSLAFHEHSPDDKAATAALVDKALESSDLLIITGGISKGKKDHIRTLIEERMSAPAFHGVAQRPGKPLAYWPGSPCVFALPGNPVSVLATFARYVVPALRQLQQLPPLTQLLLAPKGLTPLESLTWFAAVAVDPGKRLTARPPRNSGDFVSIATATGVLEVPPGAKLSPGKPLTYHPFSP